MSRSTLGAIEAREVGDRLAARRFGRGGPGHPERTGLVQGNHGMVRAVLAAAALAVDSVIAVVLPVLVFAVRDFVVTANGRVARDPHGGEAWSVRTLLWGAVWPTVCVAPLTRLVGLVHALVRMT